jgi:hypothetical protein
VSNLVIICSLRPAGQSKTQANMTVSSFFLGGWSHISQVVTVRQYGRSIAVKIVPCLQ